MKQLAMLAVGGIAIGLAVVWDVLANWNGNESYNNGWREIRRKMRIE